MALDLSKIPAVELPKKEISVTLLGVKQTLTVSAYDDGTSLDIADIAEAHPDSQERRVRKLLLMECAKLDEDTAEKLIRFHREAVYDIINAVFELRNDFVKARQEETEKAQKNLTGEKSADMPN